MVVIFLSKHILSSKLIKILLQIHNCHAMLLTSTSPAGVIGHTLISTTGFVLFEIKSDWDKYSPCLKHSNGVHNLHSHLIKQIKKMCARTVQQTYHKATMLSIINVVFEIVVLCRLRNVAFLKKLFFQIFTI